MSNESYIYISKEITDKTYNTLRTQYLRGVKCLLKSPASVSALLSVTLHESCVSGVRSPALNLERLGLPVKKLSGETPSTVYRMSKKLYDNY